MKPAPTRPVKAQGLLASWEPGTSSNTNKLTVAFTLIMLSFCSLESSAQQRSGTVSPLRPGSLQNLPAERNATNHTQPITELRPGTTILVQEDNGTAHLGASVYSTGADDIFVNILPARTVFGSRNQRVYERPLQRPNESRSSARPSHPPEVYERPLQRPNESGFTDGIYLLSPGPERFIASNRQGGRLVNLGKLPAGEIIFAIKTPQNNTMQTGDGPRNPDNLPHAVIKTFKSGQIQVWFEDLLGPKGHGSDRDYNDAVFQLSGGISDNGAVADLLKIIKEQQGETRAAAIAALKKINPKAAANAGVR